MRGFLVGFGGVWKTWLKFVRDDVYVCSLVVKTPNKYMLAAFKCAGFWINDYGPGVE